MSAKIRNFRAFEKLRRSKKGFNDVSLLFGIMLLFVLLGALLPFINAEFNVDSASFSTDDFDDDIDDLISTTQISSTEIILSILKMFFWTFGDLPFWLDSLFVVIRITFGVLLFRQIRSGGG